MWRRMAAGRGRSCEGSLGIGVRRLPRRTRLWGGKEESGWVGGALRVCVARRASELVMSKVEGGHLPGMGQPLPRGSQLAGRGW